MGIVKSGICGTCVWEIDSEWTLTISPADGKNGVLCSEDSRCWPWRPYFCAKKIVIKEGVKTGADARSMFIGMTDCAEFDISALDVSDAEFMSNMFEDCRALTDISSLKKWDVSKVADMACMFCGCRSLVDISALEKWDVSKAAGMSCMFFDCWSLENISAVKKWNISKVADMSHMFNSCESLKDISALAGWNVSGVRNMSDMFGDCRALTDISSLKKWDVSKVIDMSCMFCGCKSLTDISPLFEWAISSVCDRAAMFCNAGVSRKTIDAFIPMACPREGAFVGYKKCRDGRIVQLEVPEDAKRSSAYGRKCRCGKVKVLNIWTRYGEEARYAVSIYNSSFVYHKGGTIEVSDFDGDRFDECAAGIHFFMTRKEAENYVW